MAKKEEGPLHRFEAAEKALLLEFLFAQLAGKSKTTVKSYLRNRMVSVNGMVVTQFDVPIEPGDEVMILAKSGQKTFRHPKLEIVYEDDDVIVIDKRSGLLSMGTDRIREDTAYYILSKYVKRQDPQNKIFIVHRLDRDTSGVMLFARSIEMQHHLQENWNECVVRRKYYAVVEGEVEKEQGRIATFLGETKALKVFATLTGEGKPAVTHYKRLKTGGGYSLMELELETGRKNQIRAHMQYIGHSVAGDAKYGAKTDPAGRVALHAGNLTFVHPRTGEQMEFTSPIPGKFLSIFRTHKGA